MKTKQFYYTTGSNGEHVGNNQNKRTSALAALEQPAARAVRATKNGWIYGSLRLRKKTWNYFGGEIVSVFDFLQFEP